MTTPSIFNYWQEWYNVENISANFSDAGWTPLDNNPFILQTRYNIPAENPRDIYICLPDGNLQYIWTIGRSNRTMGLCSDDSPPYIAVFLYTRGDASVHFYPHTPCSVKTLLPCQGTNQDGQSYFGMRLGSKPYLWKEIRDGFEYELLSITAKNVVGTARRIDFTDQIQLKIDPDCAEDPLFKFAFICGAFFFIFGGAEVFDPM